MRFDVLTLFPEMFAPVKTSILARAEAKGLISIDVRNIRDYSKDKRKKTDDAPFGGGNGMVMMPEPLFGALRDVGTTEKTSGDTLKGKRTIYLSPRGRVLDKSLIDELALEDELILVCGHYEGVDQRVLDRFSCEEISIGDYILTGGELAAMVLIDSVSRMVPGVLSKQDAATDESIYTGLLEYPQYSQPRSFEDMNVPEVLLEGDHEKVRLWRLKQSLLLTKERRPDLYRAFCEKHEDTLSKSERKVLEEVRNDKS